MKLLQKIKLHFKLYSEVRRLQDDLGQARMRIQELKLQVGDPRVVVEKIYGRGIKWFNHLELTTEARKKYYEDAQKILHSEVFNNITNLIIARLTQENVRQYNPDSKSDPSRDTQMQLNALELIREELEDVPDPSKEAKDAKDDFDQFSSI